MSKITIVPITINGSFPMGYSPGLWLYDKVELEDHTVLVKNFDTEMRDGICFVEITGKIIVSNKLDEARIEVIETFDRATSRMNGVVADIWNVKVRVDRDQIMTTDLDALQKSMQDDNKN
ncbi:hypothetical protein GCM10011332_31880 [Terasakiella brassicae]|uniref:Uncharacterized protein n=1 Tax=Terasakiella brassicae TaxID=1634917 RepID=A0A917FGJ6_9PROT|nr:hypothetical protein [Terasakiella brassicae]GGF75510.1 hypothetical protein GCM10011332_31880 [Terasakiella brassicae]